MSRRRTYLFSLTALLLSVLSTAGFAGYTSIAQETKTPQTFAGDAALKNVANYRQWTRANDIPLPVSFSLVNGASLNGPGRFTAV